MTRSRKLRFIVPVVIAAVVASLFLFKITKRESAETAVESEVVVTNGNVRIVVKSTANVEPQNRLEVKPPTAGRIEEILVKEGDRVKSGQIIGWMSSTERAALLDAARAHGAEELAYWKEVYKPAALTAPIDGEVIVRDFEPGQSLSVSSAVVVLSDRLIVKAQVDETDIGKVKVGQVVDIVLDAYPEVQAKGRVDQISYESKLVSNVTIYEVDIVLEKVPEMYRSGMSASVTIVCGEKMDVPLIWSGAVSSDKDGFYVMVRATPGAKPERRKVIVGITDDRKDEILEGLRHGDVVVVMKKQYQLPSKNTGSPFMPFSGKQKERK